MKKFVTKILAIVVCLSIVAPVFGRSGVEIEYDPVKILKNSDILPLELTISNFSGVPVTEIAVQYRFAGESRFRLQRLRNEGFTYYANLNVGQSGSELVEYYFVIQYLDARHEEYPGGAPVSNLFRTALQRMRNYGDDIVIISPEPDEQIFSNDIVITASFARFASLVDVEKTKLYLDTWDVSRYLLKYEDFVSFAPRRVPTGRHKIRLELYDENSTLVASREWFFTALQSQSEETVEGAFKISGRLFAELRREDLQDGAFVNDYNQSALQLRGNYNNLAFGGRVYLNNQESDVTQPVNRFSGFARYSFWNNRYLNVTAGDAYPKFNPEILQNIFVRGFSGSLYLKFINLDIASGKTLRAIEGSAESVAGNPDTVVVQRYGTYRRNIFAVRPSFGAGENFQLGLTYLKGVDDTSSILYGHNPEENVAAGMDMFVGLDQQRIVFEGNVNASSYNSNITGGSIPFDSLQKVMEGDLSSSDEKYYNMAKKFITVNQYLILQPGVSYQARLRLRYYRNNFSILYESVDEDYHSLGQPYLLRDNRGYQLVDNISVLRNQVFLTLGFRHYHNNLQNNKTSTTTNRNIYANLSYFPLGNFPEITIGYNNYSRNNDISADSIASVLYRPEDNQSNSINFSTGYRFNFLNLKQRVGFNLTNYRRTDIYKYAESSSDYMSINLRTQYNIPLQTQLEFVLQQTETGAGTSRESKLDLATVGAGAQYTFQNLLTTDQLQIRFNARFGTLSSVYKLSDQSYDYTRNYYTFRINYSVPRFGTLGLMADILTYQGDRSSSDSIISARYDYNF